MAEMPSSIPLVFVRARAYFLEHDGRLYDSKALHGVALTWPLPAAIPDYFIPLFLVGANPL
jgi:hypothetical protein